MAAALRVAVVGAGVAGLACAATLRDAGAEVVVFDQALAPGGRLATRRTEHGDFDHGAQYITAHTLAFDTQLQRWVEAGALVPWPARVIAYDRHRRIDTRLRHQRYVGAGGMQALARHLARDLDLRLQSHVQRLERRGALWYPVAGDAAAALRGFDAAVAALPSAPAAELLQGHTPIAAVAAGVRWESCWAAMLAISRPTGIDYDAAFVNDDPILGWIARDDSKPGRARIAGVAERWLLHARPLWSRKYLDLTPEAAAHWLSRSFAARVGRPIAASHLIGHRWRHATPTRPLAQPFLWDAQARVGAAGDWCGEPRVEGAFLSGRALAQAIVGASAAWSRPDRRVAPRSAP